MIIFLIIVIIIIIIIIIIMIDKHGVDYESNNYLFLLAYQMASFVDLV